jgi:hypothetical protein
MDNESILNCGDAGALAEELFKIAGPVAETIAISMAARSAVMASGGVCQERLGV